jgi:hypothetical protein
MLDGLSDELATTHPSLVLLGNGQLDQVVLALDGDQNVHFGRLGGDDFCVDALLGEVQLDACLFFVSEEESDGGD